MRLPNRQRTHRHPALLMALLCALALAVACEDGPGGPAVDFEEVFEPSEAIVEPMAGATLLRMAGVRFNTSPSLVLTDASYDVLDKLAVVFERMPGSRVSIEVHIDSAGPADTNLALTQNRAEVIRDYLIAAAGGEPAVITAVGYGEEQPIGNNSTRAGRAENRRVEIVVQNRPTEPVFRVSMSADRMDVTQDCDAFSGTPNAEAGDFFVQVGLAFEDDDRDGEISRSLNTLYRFFDGDSSDVDVVAEGLFLASSDADLELWVEWYEDDGGGLRQFELDDQRILRYDAGLRCWEDREREIIVVGSGKPNPRARCVAGPNGEIVSGKLRIDEPASQCVAELDWSLTAERIDR